jgi:inner membrane protein involved in colicin E2 resistance
VAWFILGGTIVKRTGDADAHLYGEVAQLWGGKHRQVAPSAHYLVEHEVREKVNTVDALGNTITQEVAKRELRKAPLPVVKSRIDVALDLEHRKRGLIWYDTYTVDFAGDFEVKNTSKAKRQVQVFFAFPAVDAIYDNFTFEVNGKAASPGDDLSQGVTAAVEIPAGATVPVRITYRSRGLDDWTYAFGPGVSQIHDFALNMKTDFQEVDFPVGTMSPHEKERTAKGQALAWKFDSLVTGQAIGLDLPEKLNPGPLASRISFFAPVSLLFFFTVMVLLGVMRGSSLHPMNYFFLSAAFFAFHLLLAYLVDIMNINAAFAISSATTAPGGGHPLRRHSGGRGPAHLFGALFLLLFLRGFFRAHRGGGRGDHPLCPHAADRQGGLGPGFRKPRGTRRQWNAGGHLFR